jgi:hypothetical protein
MKFTLHDRDIEVTRFCCFFFLSFDIGKSYLTIVHEYVILHYKTHYIINYYILLMNYFLWYQLSKIYLVK